MFGSFCLAVNIMTQGHGQKEVRAQRWPWDLPHVTFQFSIFDWWWNPFFFPSPLAASPVANHMALWFSGENEELENLDSFMSCTSLSFGPSQCEMLYVIWMWLSSLYKAWSPVSLSQISVSRCINITSVCHSIKAIMTTRALVTP